MVGCVVHFSRFISLCSSPRSQCLLVFIWPVGTLQLRVTSIAYFQHQEHGGCCATTCRCDACSGFRFEGGGSAAWGHAKLRFCGRARCFVSARPTRRTAVTSFHCCVVLSASCLANPLRAASHPVWALHPGSRDLAVARGPPDHRRQRLLKSPHGVGLA